MKQQPACSRESGTSSEWSSTSDTYVWSGSSACVSSESTPLLSKVLKFTALSMWNILVHTTHHSGHCWALVRCLRLHCAPRILVLTWPPLCPILHPFHQNTPSSPCYYHLHYYDL